MPGVLVTALEKRLEYLSMKVNGPMKIPLEIASPQAIRSAVNLMIQQSIHRKLDNRKDDS